MAFDSVFTALWRYGAAGTEIEPTPGTWNWNEAELVVTQLALSHTDDDLIDRADAFGQLIPGDRVQLRSTSTADNWALFQVVTNTDNTTWRLLEVTVLGVGTVPGLPVFRQMVLFNFLRETISVVGSIAQRFDEIVARVAANLHADPTDEWIPSAVNAAIEYAILKTNRIDEGLPDTELTVNGVVGFSTRIYLDAFSPGGAQVAVADPSFVPIFQPERLWKHWSDYFTIRQVAWGVA